MAVSASLAIFICLVWLHRRWRVGVLLSAITYIKFWNLQSSIAIIYLVLSMKLSLQLLPNLYFRIFPNQISISGFSGTLRKWTALSSVHDFASCVLIPYLIVIIIIFFLCSRAIAQGNGKEGQAATGWEGRLLPRQVCLDPLRGNLFKTRSPAVAEMHRHWCKGARCRKESTQSLACQGNWD